MELDENPNKFQTIFGWKATAVIGTVEGLLIGRLSSSDKVCRLAGIDTNVELVNMLAKRFQWSNVTRGSITGGLISGTALTTYIGVHNWCAEKRGVVDLSNCSVAGAASASTITSLMHKPGLTMTARVCGVAVGALVGAVGIIPFGWVHVKVLELEKSRGVRAEATFKGSRN